MRERRVAQTRQPRSQTRKSTTPGPCGEGEVIVDLDFSLIDRRKAKMDSSGHYSRPELLSLLVDHTPAAHVHERHQHQTPIDDEDVDYARL